MQLYLVLLYLLAGLAAPQSNDGVFYNPPQYGPNGDFSQNPVYQIGSTVQLRWTVSWDRISMTLWQNGNNDFEYLLRKDNSRLPCAILNLLTIYRSQRLESELLQLDRQYEERLLCSKRQQWNSILSCRISSGNHFPLHLPLLQYHKCYVGWPAEHYIWSFGCPCNHSYGNHSWANHRTFDAQ